MKIPNKRELQGIAINHSSDIDFERLYEAIKEMYSTTILFFLNDTTLDSDNSLCFRYFMFYLLYLLERI